MADRARPRQRALRVLVIAAGLMGGGIMLGIFLAGCGSTGPRDLVGGGGAALERTQRHARLAAGGDMEGVEASIDRFLRLFSSFDPQSVADAAREVYAAEAYLNDGFAELQGREAIAEYLARTAAATAQIEIEVEDRVVADGEIYLRWVMSFTTSGRRSRTIIAPGITHLRLDDEGRVVYHRDYWDGSGALAELVPLLGPALRAIRARVESG